MTAKDELRILVLEDIPEDVKLIDRALRQGGLKSRSTHVESRSDFLAELEHHPPDLILADHALPSFNGFAALELAQSLRPEIPFIFVSGSMGEEVAIETFNKGATDYVLKSKLLNLVPAVVRALREADERAKRRLAEEALRQNEKRFRALIENSMDAVALIDARGTFLYASPSTARVLGYSVEQLVGGNALDLLHPDDFSKTADLLARWAQQAGADVTAQHRVRHQNGSWVWLETVGTNLLSDPNVRAFVLNYRDISERKRTEERLQTLVEQHAAIADFGTIALVGSIDLSFLLEEAVRLVTQTLQVEHAAVFELNAEGTALRMTAAAGWEQDLVGRVSVAVAGNSQEGHTLLSNTEVLVEDLASETRFDWPPWLLRRGVVTGLSVPIKGREQPLGVLVAHSTQRRKLLHEYTYFLKCIAYRLAAATERRRAHEEIARLNAELEQRVVVRTAELKAAYQEMEAFSYSISHDLRAPLRHIGGFVQLLQQEAAAGLDESCQSYLTTIADATQHMGRLIDDLLELSRTSRAELHLTRFSLKELVASVRRDLHKECLGREIEWIIGDLPEIEGDPNLLRQVLVNLLSNALKYSRPQPKARIEIGSNTSEPEEIFFIRDNGVGFDMRYAGKLFGVFQRLHRPQEFEGTGVGLANVRRIIERHGGRVWAEGEVGQGATFFFTLPKLRPNA